MLTLNRIHHAAIIASDVAVSKRFYTECLGLKVVGEHFRAERNSWKLDLALPDGSQIELFTFPGAPPRPSWPEAQGLRHLAFEVDDVAACKQKLEALGVAVQPVRVDEFTGRRFVFFEDPDGLPLELYEWLSPHSGAGAHGIDRARGEPSDNLCSQCAEDGSPIDWARSAVTSGHPCCPRSPTIPSVRTLP